MPINIGRIESMILTQEKSTLMWVSQYQRWKDESSIKNAAFALGKLSSLINLYSQLLDGELPENIKRIEDWASKIWDEM